MAQVHRQVGSLSQLMGLLKIGNITFINTIEDVSSFKDTFQARLSEIKLNETKALSLEIEDLNKTLSELSKEYDLKIKDREITLKNRMDKLTTYLEQTTGTNLLSKAYSHFLRIEPQNQLKKLTANFDEEVKRPFGPLERRVESYKKHIRSVEENREQLIAEKVEEKSKSLNAVSSAIAENGPLLIGAIGEQKAIGALKMLPDSFQIINDFRYRFSRPLFEKRTGQYISSIQADHIVIGPTGVYVIETKNWGPQSVASADFYSPIEQIRRTEYAVFMLVNNDAFKPLYNHWGQIKVNSKCVLLMVGSKPIQEFQYVKVLSLNNLCHHITNCESTLASIDVQNITKYLLQICEN